MERASKYLQFQIKTSELRSIPHNIIRCANLSHFKIMKVRNILTHPWEIQTKEEGNGQKPKFPKKSKKLNRNF